MISTSDPSPSDVRPPSSRRLRRITGTRRASIWFALVFNVLFDAALAVPVPSDLSPFPWMALGFASALLLWLVRAFFMGVLISDRTLRVHGWYHFRDFPIESIERLEIDGYSGGLNGNLQSNIDPFYRYGRMLVLRINGKEKEFPTALFSRRTADRVQESLLAVAPWIRLTSGAHGSVRGKRAKRRDQ